MENIRILLADSDASFVNECAAFLIENGYTTIDTLDKCCDFDVLYSSLYDCAIVDINDLFACQHPLPLQYSFSSIILTSRKHTIETELLARSLRPAIYLVKPVANIDILSVVLRILEIKERNLLEHEIGVKHKKECVV